MPHARYNIIREETTHDRLVIRDVGHSQGCLTVTNDAEDVVLRLAAYAELENGRRLFYYDSENNLDEILHDGKKFLGFKAHREEPHT